MINLLNGIYSPKRDVADCLEQKDEFLYTQISEWHECAVFFGPWYMWHSCAQFQAMSLKMVNK